MNGLPQEKSSKQCPDEVMVKADEGTVKAVELRSSEAYTELQRMHSQRSLLRAEWAQVTRDQNVLKDKVSALKAQLEEVSKLREDLDADAEFDKENSMWSSRPLQCWMCPIAKGGNKCLDFAEEDMTISRVQDLVLLESQPWWQPL